MGIESDPIIKDPRGKAAQEMEEAKKSAETTESAGEKLSPTSQEIKDMALNYDDQEFGRVARSDPASMETSTDAFLRSAKYLIEGGEPGPNTWGSMSRILNRPSMKNHPKIDLFRRAVDELAEKYGQKLKK